MPIIQTPRAKEFIHLLWARLAPETASHCIFTAEFMTSYADQAGITVDQAVTAGLLHDLCKGRSGPDLLAAAEEYGIVPNEAQRAWPALLHGPVAAEESRRTLGIQDDAIYEAIYWHTTGCPGMGRVGLALFFADFAEPLRKFPEAVEARELLRERGFRFALRYAAAEKAMHIRQKKHVDPVTERFHAWLQTAVE
jgi:predicted HD superfamily hydrolase involved in NAD metabolism